MGKRKEKIDVFQMTFKDLPVIDFEKGRQMMQVSDFSIPENWPANWPWLVAMHDALVKAQECEQRAVRLQHSVGTFREMLLRGDVWPTAKD